MSRVPIVDIEDPRVARYRHLKATNLTRGGDEFVVEGEKLFERLLESPFPLASVLVSERLEPRVSPRVPDDVPLYVMTEAQLSALVGFKFHRGVLACGRRRSWPALEQIVARAGRWLTIVVCPAIHNPENLGAIVRLCDVFGIDAVLVGGGCPDPLSRRILRVSMGTALRLPVIVSDDLSSALDGLRAKWDVQLAATVVDTNAEPLDSFRRAGRLALLLGCEGEGLSREWIERCDRQITIPMRPGAESLNVAVAAGILLYFAMREPAGEPTVG